MATYKDLFEEQRQLNEVSLVLKSNFDFNFA